MALTQTRAQQRSQCIESQSIFYRFHLNLESGQFYDGLSQIRFTLKHVPQALQLDCKAKEIKKLFINKEEVKEIKTEEGFILLDVNMLKGGENYIAVLYRTKYDNDGNGCVSFIDVDEKQYLYTQFEPYYANRVFALFDQPDLKAPMQLTIISPYQWKRVISNENASLDDHFQQEQFIKNAHTFHEPLLKQFIFEKKGRMSIFPKTKMLPTYLYCFVAGPYQRLELKDTHKNIPMSLYSIQSLFKYLEQMAPFISEITMKCMVFFQYFFGHEFPFNKYDQVFAHQYKAGAMENAGIVTFNDIYIWKDKVSDEKMQDLANTISHQLSHHWFGNLVTMKWWDDLWLNESFAEFISHFCLEKVRKDLTTVNIESSMASFLARKAWGYYEDQLVTTHAIRGQVANTIVADSIFDGITYSKGASTMKQLLFIMSQQNFSKSLKAYFHKYAFKNATLQDFIAEMQVNFHEKALTLKEWQQFWLETASLNRLEPKWDPNAQSPNEKLTIIQTPYVQKNEKLSTLRPHKIKIAFFREDASSQIIETLLKPQEINQVTYDGTNKFKAILLNYEDHTFAKVNFDKDSIAFFSQNAQRIPDVLTRTLIWRNFFDMVKDGVIPSNQYIDIFLSNIVQEKSDSIIERHFDYVNSAINTFTPRTHREPMNDKLFDFIFKELSGPHANEYSANRLVILRAKLCNFAHSQRSKKVLLSWKRGENEHLKNHKMTIGQQWSTVVKAFAMRDLAIEQKQKIFEEQKLIDNSDTAKLKRATCDSLKANKEEFQRIYQSFKDPKNQQSITLKSSVATGWNHSYHLSWLAEYKQRYFMDIVEISKILEGDHFEFFIEHLQPIDDNLEESITEFKKIHLEGEKFDKNNTDILKTIDDLQRRKKVYSTFEKSLK